MVAQSYLTDGTAEIVTLSDRTVGVASLAYGEFEAMLHRRCSQDDGRGVGEALNDQNIVYPRLRFFVGSAQNMERIRCASCVAGNLHVIVGLTACCVLLPVLTLPGRASRCNSSTTRSPFTVRVHALAPSEWCPAR